MDDHLKNIKGFFNKKVANVKFKLAGTGHKLNEQNTPVDSSNDEQAPVRCEPSAESQRAGTAALNRLANTSTSQSVPTKKTSKLMAQARAEVMKEFNNIPSEVTTKKQNEPTVKKQQKESLVNFRCPLISPEVLTHDEWMVKIGQYLEELAQMDPENPVYFATMIKSLNEPEKANFACEKLKLCLQNIIDNPSEEKYKKIKAHNPLLKDKLLPIAGCENFLLLSGFQYVTIDDVLYLVFQSSEDELKKFVEALEIAEPITLILDRNTQVKQSSKKQQTSKESDEFFKLSKEEIKTEAAKRAEEIEEMKILKTRAMREKSLNTNQEPVEYAEIKIKFPDGFSLQGTFKVDETVQDVRQFVLEHLNTKSESFNLLTGLGRNILDPTKSLTDEKLVPSSLVHFEWEKDIDVSTHGYLCVETIALST